MTSAEPPVLSLEVPFEISTKIGPNNQDSSPEQSTAVGVEDTALHASVHNEISEVHEGKGPSNELGSPLTFAETCVATKVGQPPPPQLPPLRGWGLGPGHVIRLEPTWPE